MPRTFWTEQQIELLRQLYSDTPMPDMIRRIGRSQSSIYDKANALGLKRSQAYLNSPLSGRLMPGDRVSKRTEFKPGQQSWNKGLKGWKAGGRSAETRFKAGHKPHTWLPVGTERVTKDGYLERKISDTGVTRHDFIPVHRLIWIEHHGPLPPGHVIAFRDQLPRHENITIERLELISRAELARRNTIHRYPPEVKQAIRLVKKLERKLQEKTDEEQHDGSA